MIFSANFMLSIILSSLFDVVMTVNCNDARNQHIKSSSTDFTGLVMDSLIFFRRENKMISQL